LKVEKLRPPVSTLKKRIHDLESNRQRWEATVAKYKRRSEKLKKQKGALEAERMKLEHQLGEARS